MPKGTSLASLALLATLCVGCGVDVDALPEGAPRAIGPTVTLAEGEEHGVTWRYIAYRTENGYCDQIVAEELTESFSMNCRSLDGESGMGDLRMQSWSATPTFVTGGVPASAETVLIETRFDGPFEVAAIEPPEELDVAFDLFVAALPQNDHVVRVVVFDAAGVAIREYETGLTP